MMINIVNLQEIV